jgi:hypothetical protein
VVDAPISHELLVSASRLLDAVVMSTAEDLLAHCRSRLCRRIPHHFNLNCSARVSPRPWLPGTRLDGNSSSASGGRSSRPVVVGVVGSLQKYAADLAPHRAELARNGLVLRSEAAGGEVSPCAFLGGIDIALAWTNPKHSSLRDLARKPAERFTNPIALNIPTVGAAALASFRLPGASPFLATAARDVPALLRAIAAGGLRAEFATLRDQVLQDVSAAALVRRYCDLFAALLLRPPLHTFAGKK